MKTQVCIIGAGPAGLLLGHCCGQRVRLRGAQRRAPEYVLGRIRAGVLEQVTVSLMERLGLDARLKAEGLPHDGFNLADGKRLIRIDIAALTGRQVVVYGQTEVTRDLMDACDERGLEVSRGCDVAAQIFWRDLHRDFHQRRRELELLPDRGRLAMASLPSAMRCCHSNEYHREYPFAGWEFGGCAAMQSELISSRHARGFALLRCARTRSRLYDVPSRHGR